MITVVSGLPRSGTSMMMQMLAAGGLSILSDAEHKADTYNPKGYLEWEPVKELPARPDLLQAAEGKAVKLFSPFLRFLPAGHEYRIILMQRPLSEVLQSQSSMLSGQGFSDDSGETEERIRDAFRWHSVDIEQWLAQREGVHVLRADYHAALREPWVFGHEVASFLPMHVDVDAMAQQVDRSLYRARIEEAA